MKLTVHAKAGSKKAKVEQIDATNFIISVTEPAQEGKANEAIRNSLAEFLKKKRSEVILVQGKKSKTKIFQIL